MTAAVGSMRTEGDSVAGTASLDPSQLLRIWLSPSFPVGSFAYSHGLEPAAARGLVSTADDLADWLAALIDHGSVRNDLILIAEAHDAIAGDDAARLATVNAMALALQPSAERHLETTQQGASFATTISAAWPCDAIANLRAVESLIAYPIAVGVAAAGHAIPKRDALSAYALAFAMNIVSAAIRLAVMGQTDGQRVLARLMPAIDRQAEAATHLTMNDLGGAAFSSDLASLEHETLYSRLFRS